VFVSTVSPRPLSLDEIPVQCVVRDPF